MPKGGEIYMANNDKKTGLNPMVASLAGAALGAAVGAGAVILSDEKNRKKLEEALEGLKKQGFDVLEIAKKEASSIKKQLTPAAEEAVKEVKKAAKKASK
jgi:gas vesicle protein